MLLRFFRINDPYRLLGLLIIIVVIGLFFLLNPLGLMLHELKSLVLGEAVHSGKMMYVQIFDDTPPLASALFGFMDVLFGRSILARQIVAIAILFFQASYFGVQLIHHKAYNENTYLPSLLFGVIAFFSFDVISFSAELVGSILLLFALNKMYSLLEFKEAQRDEIVLKLGIYLGLSTFLVFSYWIFLIGCLVILVIFARLKFRRGALLIFGFLLPHCMLFTYYFYFDNVELLWLNFYKSNFTLSGEILMSMQGMLILGAIPVTYFIFSLLMVNRLARLTKYQSQITQVMFLWLVIACIQIAIARIVTPYSFITFIPSLAYFISHYLLLIRRKWIAEIMLWTYILGIVSVSLLSKQGRIETVNYQKLYPAAVSDGTRIKGKRVMVLGSTFNLYQHNSLGGYFLNWKLSKPVLEDVSNYANVEIISSCFEIDPPEIIVDENKMASKIFDRIPSLKSQYRKEGSHYVRINY